MVKKPIFDNFSEYWYYARSLSENQRKIIFRSLPTEQKASLDSSYRKDGWNDVFYRNEVNERLDELKDAYGYDLVDIRLRVLKGKSVYLPSKFWQIVEEQMSQYRPYVVHFAVSGLRGVICEINPEVCLIVKDWEVSE